MEHTFIQAFRQYWQLHFDALQPSDSSLIVAVSGGVDSVVLTHVLHELNFNFTIAHCNFHLRDAESDRDENFVRQYAAHIGKPFVCKHFDTVAYADECKLGIEEAARELRYTWFRQLADAQKIGEKSLPIFVAHHANDNVETVLMNFFRGCGIAGLHGILPIKDGIYRPLLFAKRKEIVSYALSQKLNWIEDSSNLDEKYRRNFLRNNIIPELKENFPTIEDNVLENIAKFQEVEMIYNSYIDHFKKAVLQKDGADYHLHVALLKEQKALSTCVYEVFKNFGFAATQTSEIIKLLDADSGARLASPTHTIWKDRTMLIVSPIGSHHDETIWLQDSAREIQLPDGTILSKESVINTSSNNTIVLDYNKLQFPLEIRHWRDGDYFYPNGMKGKKKLAKYFIDQKIPNPIKQKIWLVVSGEDIVWVVGHRADRRFVAQEETDSIFRLTHSALR